MTMRLRSDSAPCANGVNRMSAGVTRSVVSPFHGIICGHMTRGRRLALSIGVPVAVGVIGGVISGVLRGYDRNTLATLVLIVTVIFAANLSTKFWKRSA